MLPLEGVRVLEAAQQFAGPHAGCLLSLLGAEVLKVEPPEGDQIRGYGIGFRSQNAGKRSMVLDLKEEAAQAAFRELLTEADILLENFRPGKLEEMGLGHKALRRLNPTLVQVSISGFGSKGPWAGEPGFDGMVQALVGMMDAYTPEGSTSEFSLPQYMPVAADIATGLIAVIGTLAGLAAVRKTGVGCHIETSLFESAINLMLVAIGEERKTGPFVEGEQRPPPMGGKPAVTQSFALAGSDGGRMVMMLAVSQRVWKNLVATPGFEALDADERFVTYPDRVANYYLLAGELQQRFATKTRQEWLDEISGVPLSPYNSPAEVAFHEQIEALELFHFEPEHGEWLWRGPWFVDGIRPQRNDKTPELGSADGWLKKE